jgi:transposase
MVRMFHEERPAPGGRPRRVADRRIVSTEATRAVPERDRDRHFIGARMVEGTKGSHHKEGLTKMSNSTTIAAGIDVAKAKLDIAVHGCNERWQVANTPAGFRDLVRLMRRHKVSRIGLEATGSYERQVVEHLRKEGFAVAVLQPIQVRGFAQLTLRRAKNDRMDAALIAACVAHLDSLREPPDPRIAPFADQLTFIEQIEEDIARIKVRLEHVREADLRSIMLVDVTRLKQRRATMIAKLVFAIRRHEDLGRRLGLLVSIDSIATRTALAFLIRMPELGSLSREQAAALAGLAPFDRDSGKRQGERHIAGGRTRLRKSVYAAALPGAFRWNAQLIALYQRLIAAGKTHKVALIACARKLVIYANAVLARGTPWTSEIVPA